MKYILFFLLVPQMALAGKMQCKITSEVNGTEKNPAVLEINIDHARSCTAHSKTYIIPKSDVLVTAVYRTPCTSLGKTTAAGIDTIEIYDQVTKNYTKTWDSRGPQQRAAIQFITNGLERVSLQTICEIIP